MKKTKGNKKRGSDVIEKAKIILYVHCSPNH